MASKTKAVQERKKRDPFAYFGGIEELDSEDDVSESDSDEGEKETKKLSYISKSSVDERKEKLPAAEDVLLSSGKPSFLTKDDKLDVDWEKLAKDDTKEEEEPINYTTNAIPPPKTYDAVSEPLKPTIGDTSVEKENLKRRSLEADDTDSVKKTKTDDT